MKFRVQLFGLRKVLTIRRNDISMFPELESLFIEQCLGDIEHRVIRASGGKVSFPICQQSGRIIDGWFPSRRDSLRADILQHR